MPVDVLVIISPRPGKEKRTGEVLTSATESIKASEPYTLNYHSYTTKGDEEGTMDYVVHIRYEDCVAGINRAPRSSTLFIAKQLTAFLGFGLTVPRAG
jgi:hypothetical protein